MQFNETNADKKRKPDIEEIPKNCFNPVCPDATDGSNPAAIAVICEV